MYLNLAWDRASSWGEGMTKKQIDERMSYYRGSAEVNPSPGIVRSLRSTRKIVLFKMLFHAHDHRSHCDRSLS